MTAPVLQTPLAAKLDAESGALLHSGYADGHVQLAFMLPAQYTNVASCPAPHDPRVLLAAHPPELVAVSTPPFSGGVNEAKVQEHLETLLKELRADGLFGAAAAPKDAAPTEQPKWHVAQYHPPFTLPWFRRNEIWCHLDGVSEEQAVSALGRKLPPDAPAL
jgi:hypothetical protein